MPQNDSFIFRVTDPRGRIIICTEKCWYRHILAARPWMSGWEDKVIATLGSPTSIFQDAYFADREVYYRRQASKGRYLKVVVRFLQDGSGRVVSAFPTDSGKEGETWIW